MKRNILSFLGIGLGGAGVAIGMTMSSSIPDTPLIYGLAAAVYGAVGAAIFAGTQSRKHRTATD